MGARFGHDFSKVRVHIDAQAAESATAVNARAYTVGRDMVFSAGQYAPNTSAGRKLLAHELAHVVQQSAARQATELRLAQEQDARERLTSLPIVSLTCRVCHKDGQLFLRLQLTS